MNVQEQIIQNITSQPEPKRRDMQELHRLILQVLPGCKLWFDMGKIAKIRRLVILLLDMGFTR